jgi:aspartate aminotransferase
VLAHRKPFTEAIRSRLDLLYGMFSRMKTEGLPVDAIEPQGAIYLSARFDLIGGEIDGNALRSNEEIRRLLLERAGIAVVPFQAFGYKPETGWFRLSVGAVSEEEIRLAEPRLRALVASVKGTVASGRAG